MGLRSAGRQLLLLICLRMRNSSQMGQCLSDSVHPAKAMSWNLVTKDPSTHPVRTAHPSSVFVFRCHMHFSCSLNRVCSWPSFLSVLSLSNSLSTGDHIQSHRDQCIFSTLSGLSLHSEAVVDTSAPESFGQLLNTFVQCTLSSGLVAPFLH